MRKIVVCNWKMNPATYKDAATLFGGTKRLITNLKNIDLVVAPPTILLRDLARNYKGKRITFAAQSISPHDVGSHTGETAAVQVRDAGAARVIIGHAEQRARGVSNEDTHGSVQEALRHKRKVILCVGEDTRDVHGNYISVVREQITTALADTPPTRYKDITIAYEPVWAVGAAEAPSAHDVHQMMLLVRKILVNAYGEKTAAKVRTLYGGAVNAENAAELFAVPDVDGVLLGRASLDLDELRGVCRAANTA